MRKAILKSELNRLRRQCQALEAEMPVQLWIGQEFDTTHERKALHNFWDAIQARFGQSDDLYLVLANYFVGGRQVDLTVLKRDAVVVIELKDCADPFRATENGDWLTIPDGNMIGTGEQNSLLATTETGPVCRRSSTFRPM
jgi:hypothetical protein